MDAEATPGTVLIVDDDPAIRQALAVLMNSAGLGSRCFASASELLDQDLPATPACLLLDLNLPGLTGMQLQEQLRDQGSSLPIIFLTGHGDVPVAVRAVQNGALGFLEKSAFAPDELIRLVRSGLDLHRQRLRARRHRMQLQQRIGQLSPRELEVAVLAASGCANKVIAIELGISERTVEVHRGRAMKKLCLRSVADLARLKELLLRRKDQSASP